MEPVDEVEIAVETDVEIAVSGRLLLITELDMLALERVEVAINDAAFIDMDADDMKVGIVVGQVGGKELRLTTTLGGLFNRNLFRWFGFIPALIGLLYEFSILGIQRRNFPMTHPVSLYPKIELRD